MALGADGANAWFFSCCGDERFVLLPSFGVHHLPTADTWRESIALPVVLFIIAASFCCSRLVIVICCRKAHLATAASVLITGAVLPEVLKGEVGEWIVAQLTDFAGGGGGGGRDMLMTDGFASALRDLRADGAHAVEAKVMSAEAARSIGSRVLARTSQWKFHLVGGLPHFLYGYKYGLGWANGSWHHWHDEWQLPDALWSDFSGMYEDIRIAIATSTGHPAKLHRNALAPAFQVHLPHFVFGLNFEVHVDPLLDERALVWEHFYKEDMQRTLGAHHRCYPQRQRTFLFSLLAPSSSGVRLWSYGENRTRCPDRGPVQLECIETAIHAYQEGSLIMFESRMSHQAVMPMSVRSLASDVRMLVVGFVVPCLVKGQVEEQIIGSFAV